MMALNLKRLEDWLIHGKTAVIPVYQPDDEAAEMAPVDVVLSAGLDATHMGSGYAQSVRFKRFAGVDGSGLTPNLNCTLAAAVLGDKVAGIIDSSDFSDAAALFESVITVAGKIQQVSLADLSTKIYLIVLYTA